MTRAIIVTVEKQVRVFRSHKEAEQADVEHDMALTPEERVNVAIDLRNRYYPDEAQQPMERVICIRKLREEN